MELQAVARASVSQNPGNETDAASASSMIDLAVRREGGDGERHGDPVIAEGIERGRAELLAAGN